jgi:hypothetical protein
MPDRWSKRHVPVHAGEVPLTTDDTQPARYGFVCCDSMTFLFVGFP